MDSQRQSKLTLGVVVAATAVVVALVIALIVAMASGGDDSDDTAAEPTPPASPSEPSPSDSQPPGDETTDVDPTGRQVTVVDSIGGTPREQTGAPGQFPEGQEMVGAPEGLELQRVQSGATLMVSRSDGPDSVDDGVMTGYARSPGGAALMAANYQGLGMEMGGAYADFLTHFMPGQVAEDPEFIDEIRSRGAAANGRALTAAEGYQAPRWFKFGQCDENFCTVEAALPSVAEAVGEVNITDVDPNEHPVLRVSLRWVGDQWEIISGRTLPPISSIDGSWSTWN